MTDLFWLAFVCGTLGGILIWCSSTLMKGWQRAVQPSYR